MSLEWEGRRRRLLDDATAIRALAHPVRLELQSVLGREGPLTAAEAARRLGISQALASHHLRQLAKYDFVEPAPGKDNRERPWRLVSISQTWRGADATPEGAAAADVLEQLLAERALNTFLDWQERRKSESPAWRDHSGIGHAAVYLTEEELAEVDDRIEAVLAEYIEQRPIDDKTTRPPGSRLVDITHFVSVLPPDDAQPTEPGKPVQAAGEGGTAVRENAQGEG
ncbi:ArsR/SmtB family transcription factor [Kribbella deserti]|uniref:ArsR/SmtB family transcription factor n=1 Tax=Kribbella deserti TaxID=1926257 RepID=A0ABV6QRN2_9ACTN